MSKQEKLISAEKLIKLFEDKQASYVVSVIKTELEKGTLYPDPVPTIKPGDTRQLLHNTIDVMTDEQVQLVAESLGLEVVKDE